MIRAAVIGASGYTGAEAARLLMGHPGFELVAASSDSDTGKPLSALYPALLGLTTKGAKEQLSALILIKHEDALACEDIELAFLAVPHTVACKMAPKLLKRGVAVIDLSADFRLNDAQVYEQWYQAQHTAPELLEHAVYGLCEFNRTALQEKAARWHENKMGSEHVLPPLVANPGCYPTATTLAIAPALCFGLMDPNAPVIINAISGVSGAGRKATATTHFCSASDDLVAYGVASHRHTPEIQQVLSGLADCELKVVFTPHLAPLKRGMVSTVVVSLAPELAASGAGEVTAHITKAYTDTYADEAFISVLAAGTMPHSASVMGTNNAQVGFAYDARSKCLIASCAIDNLGKGATTQAIQNANIIFGFAETAGLDRLGTLV
ncbi:MAG: N-acetyl-gamma-glutamyl-phosphate reductase [Coriobacteriia bacterium]|nr:N-acetyl-gamma-glutamyl-phosphate reductase [Coriobacteriia bacterium]